MHISSAPCNCAIIIFIDFTDGETKTQAVQLVQGHTARDGRVRPPTPKHRFATALLY